MAEFGITDAQRFWREHPIDRFDLEECGSGYMSYRGMRLNETGDWIRADDHREAVTRAEARVLEARDRASVAAREMSRCHRLWQEDKSKLAAANALLEECLIALFDVPHDPFHELVTNIRAHLSAQPAPLSDDLGDALAQARAELECARRERDTWRSLCETAERKWDDAEARVRELEAALAASEQDSRRLHTLLDERWRSYDTTLTKLAAANVLLAKCLRDLETDPNAEDYYAGLIDDLRAHLSAQTAVLSDDLGDALAQVADAEHERAAPSLGHPGADEVFARLREARQSAAQSEPRKGEAFAKYHDEQASYGGVSWEFHARAATFCRDADERVATAESDLAQLRERVAKADELLRASAELDSDTLARRALGVLRGK